MDDTAGTMGVADGQPSPDRMRAADSDRERVAEQLRSAHADGRLDLTEYDERLQQAWAARTYGELETLTADLPQAQPPRAPADPARGAAARPAARAQTWRARGSGVLGQRKSDLRGDLGTGVLVHHELELSLVDLGCGSLGRDAARWLDR